MTRTVGTWALVAIGAMTFGVTAPALTTVSVVDLGSLGGTHNVANAINNRLQVVGDSTVASGFVHPFLWEDGTMRDLGLLPGGIAAFALDINNRGQIVGGGSTGLDETLPHAILWDDGAVIDLGTLPGGSSSQAYGINARGQIVGISDSAAGQRAVLWDGGVAIDLGTLPGGDYSEAFDISDSGRVVGVASTATGERHAFLWEPGGTMIDLGALPGGDQFSQALGVNNRGQVVGRSANIPLQTDRAFLWDNGTMRDLHPSGATYSQAFDINDRGQAAGVVGTPALRPRAARFYRGTVVRLPQLPGEEISIAHGINDRGYIVGVSSVPAAGGSRAVLWMPLR